jgi:hypothetical protein
MPPGNPPVFQKVDSTVTVMQCHGFFVVANCAPPQIDKDGAVGSTPIIVILEMNYFLGGFYLFFS